MGPAALDIIDPNQFGAIPKSSTTQALISMVHDSAKATDGNSSAVRIVLLDYKKVFDCFAKWALVPSGIPQGTKVGPWLFLLMINDLHPSEAQAWKYVDNTTLAEVVQKSGNSSIQCSVTEMEQWSIRNI